MSPFFVPGCKVLNPVATFNRFVVVPEPGVFHCFSVGNKQATQRIRWHCVNRALGFPIARRIPLACCTCAHQFPTEHNLQNPIRESSAIEKPGALPTRQPLAPGTASIPVKVFALGFDVVFIFSRLCAVVPHTPVRRGTVLAPCAEHIRPANAQQSNLPSNPLKRVAALLQFSNLIVYIFCRIHPCTPLKERGQVCTRPRLIGMNSFKLPFTYLKCPLIT